MAPATQPVPIEDPAARPGGIAKTALHPQVVPKHSALPDDGTRQLLKWGALTFGTGLFCALLIKILFGGIGHQGPHTNSGWMALIVTMMCLPFGFLLLLLGILKWLRNRRQR